ncbi:MAG TPA: T9SS type A sorting domain-containing protein, partial [Flavobacteriales bacterium]|nr:T9SS type A sorting domain-containing protein [Flavobacteriales bacterium]
IYSTPSPPIICLGDTITLEFWNTPLTNIVWVPTGDTTHMIHDNPNSSTTYIVEGIDVNGCDRRGEVLVSVYQSTPLNPMTVPNPPSVCVGDSVVIEVNQGFVNYWWNTGSPLDQGEDRVVIYPTQDFTYVVEALDSNGCESREEILVLVDTCATGMHSEMFSKINIYPNPTSDKVYIDLPTNEIFTISVLSMEGKLILQEIEVLNSIMIDSKKLTKGSYILRIENNKGTFNQIVIFE